MIESILVNFFCAGVGTMGYAVLYNVPKRYYFWAGMTGGCGWLVYCFVEFFGASATLCTFCGTVFVVLVSRVLAVYMRCPITIFLISGIFPMIPGSAVYYTVYYVVMNELTEAAMKGVHAFKLAFAIALGIVFVVSIPKKWFVWERLMRKINNRSIVKENKMQDKLRALK